MAFRMASYLRLDAPCLLYLPSGKELTEFEKDARDRCWRTCILTDNIHATISGHPRFFHYSFSQVASAGFFQYIPPNDLGKESLMYYLTTLSEVMFSIKECVSLPLSTAEEVESYRVRIRETEGRLTEWKFSLPPSFDVEASEAWSSVEMIGDVPVDVDRITIYLGYHACNCLIYRSRLLVVDSFADNQPRSAARSFDVAFRSAVLIAMTAKKTLSLKCFRSTLFPLSGYCVLISGLVLCNICSQFSDSVQEEEIRALVMVEMEFLKKMSEFWLMSKPWLDLLEAEFQHIL
ncbi:hypothetical protein BC829DRAFT_67371 [Chytridium lagenaria]|nr:hypothetical protein BC829DRAFT_67371 [Chytridium lagenaria]